MRAINNDGATLSLLRRGASLEEERELVDRVGKIDAAVLVAIHEHQIGCGRSARQLFGIALEKMAQEADHVREVSRTVLVAVGGELSAPRTGGPTSLVSAALTVTFRLREDLTGPSSCTRGGGGYMDLLLIH